MVTSYAPAGHVDLTVVMGVTVPADVAWTFARPDFATSSYTWRMGNVKVAMFRDTNDKSRGFYLGEGLAERKRGFMQSERNVSLSLLLSASYLSFRTALPCGCSPGRVARDTACFGEDLPRECWNYFWLPNPHDVVLP